MIDKLKSLIASEDKKNPLTDQELSDYLRISRVSVTKLRKQNGIPTSADRRKDLLVKNIKEIMSDNPRLSERKLTQELETRGFKVSRSLVRNLYLEHKDSALKNDSKNKIEQAYKDMMSADNYEGIFKNDGISINKSEGKKDKSKELIHKEKIYKYDEVDDGFENIIGRDGSLKGKIGLLKSAMMYPPNGLHTIIYGETGVGKSAIAESMYNFSVNKGYKKKDSPFVVFNCADYAENPNLLVAQLFGIERGAYTGATQSKPGMVEKADGGILFLDEIHRLPPSGQEILFSLIDRGRYRRLGESNFERKSSLTLICATTENPESNLLRTFRRRIPMICNLPNLAERPVEERYEMIVKFFEIESRRVNKNFFITREVLLSLLNYDCPGNIGQLKSDIQVTCARAFSKAENNSESISIEKDSLRDYIRNTKNHNSYDDKIEDIYIDNENNQGRLFGNNSISEIYQYAENQLKMLEKKNYSEEEIKDIFLSKLDNKFTQILESKKVSGRKEISTYLNDDMTDEVLEIMPMVEDIISAQYRYVNLDLYPALAVHLQHTIKRIKEGKTIKNPGLYKIKQDKPFEYDVARYISTIAEEVCEVRIPEDELGYLAYYINKFCYNDQQIDRKVKVIIVTHGKVGIEMSNVVNNLLGVECTMGMEIDLDKTSQEGIKTCLDKLEGITAPKGIIFLIDMGSLVMLEEEVEKRYSIRSKTVNRVDTLLAMEVGKMAFIESKSLDEIYKYCEKSRGYNIKNQNCDTLDIENIPNDERKNDEKNKIIITACLSGNGNAKNLMRILEKKLKDKGIDIEILPIGILGETDIDLRLREIEKEKDIACVVGTIEVGIDGIPFLNYNDAVETSGINEIISIINDKNSFKKISEDNIELGNIIYDDLILYDFEGISKEYVIDAMVSKLEEGGYVDQKYILSVYKREAMGTVVLNQKIAIPHGLPEYVKKPAIAIAKLSKPIIWDNEFVVDYVIMIAVKESNKNEMKQLFNIIGNPKILDRLSKADSKDAIKMIFE